MNMKTHEGSLQLQYLQRMGIDVWIRRRHKDNVTMPAEGGGAVHAAGDPPTQPGIRNEDAADADPGQPVADASEVASLGWEALRERVQQCRRCPLYQTRTQGVFGIGNPQAQLMLIGEAPGAEEDRRGEPFVGRAGKLLDEMLRAIGSSREAVYITNVLKSRPPNNRDPRPDEVAACEPYLRRQLELVSPRVILVLGRIATQYLLKSTQSLSRLRGQWHQYGPCATPLRVTYHPAYLLRSPADKYKAWQDLKHVCQRLRDESPL